VIAPVECTLARGSPPICLCAKGELRTKQTAKVEAKIDENRTQHIPIANPAPCSSATPHVLSPEEQIDANDPTDVERAARREGELVTMDGLALWPVTYSGSK
jgi:hypothetical protein